jgi:hypothetical protein
MNQISWQIYGGSNKKANTFIGGVAATIGTASLLATKLGISESRITSFNVVGSDIQCRIGGSYTLPNYTFYGDTSITYFKDIDGLIQNLNTPNPSFADNVNMTSFISKNITSILGTYYFRNTPLLELYFPILTSLGFYAMNGRSNKTILYAPNLITIGSAVNVSQGALTQLPSSSTVYVNDFLRTCNSGNPHWEIQRLINIGATVRYVTNFTAPNQVTDLTAGTIYNTAVQLNFTAPSSANVIDYYECYVNKVLQNIITASGQFITGLTTNTTYTIEVKPVDIFYNKSTSNIIEVITL